MTTQAKKRVIKYFERIGDVTTRVNPYRYRNEGDMTGVMLCDMARDRLLATRHRYAVAEFEDGGEYRIVEARWVFENPWG